MLSWVGCLPTLFILFAENNQILLKISVIPILLTFIYLVALNLSVNRTTNSTQCPTELIIAAHKCHKHFLRITILQNYINLRRSYCFILVKLQPYLIMGLKIHCFVQFFITFFMIGLINGNPFWDQAPFRSRLELEKSPQLQENKIDWGDEVWFFYSFLSF